MPILAGILSAVFYQFFGIFAARLTFNIAFALAIAAVAASAFLALKIAMAAIWSTLPSLLPDVVINALQLVLPSNTGTVLAAIILTDVIKSSYDYWRQAAGLVAVAMK